jgi:nitroreductase
MPQLNLSADEVLTTTRAVRKRLDLDRPVPDSLLRECLDIAVQAPSGSNSQGWHFMLVTDDAKKSAIADYYRKAFDAYQESPNRPSRNFSEPAMVAAHERILDSAHYLVHNLARVPVLMIPCCTGRPDARGVNLMGMASIFGSILPAVWSFMLAARERGLGTCWTTLHLSYEREIAALLGIPDTHAQVALIPIAYTRGTDFQPAPRKDLDQLLHTNNW